MDLKQALTPVRMRKLRVLILDDFIDDVLISLQNEGSVHIISIEDTLPRWEQLFQPYSVQEEVGHWQAILNRIDVMLTELEIKKELGLLEQLFKPRERVPTETTLKEEIACLRNAENIVTELEKEVEEKMKKFRAFREILWDLSGKKIAVEKFRSTDRLYVKLGKIPREEIPLLENELNSRVKFASVYVSGKKRLKIIVIVSLIEFSEEIEKILKKYTFQEVMVPEELSGDPNSCLRLLDSQSGILIKKYERQIFCLYDAIVGKIERMKIKEKLGKTKRVSILEGWVPEARSEHVKALIEESAQGNATVLLSAADEPESKVPTLLNERKVLGSFGILTEMYGIPLYNEIDPTPFLAIFFTFFIGLMSADIAIGTTITIASILIRRGAGSRSKNMRNLSVVLLCIGISAILFGVLMGEVMGGVVKLPIIWMSAAENPIEFLLIVIWIGMAHIASGSVLGIINNFYKRQFRRIVGNQLSTLFLLSSASIFLSTGRFEFQGISLLGYALGFVGLIMLILGSGLSGLLELTRLLSNVISYVRILAINMATAWMSRTFLLLGSLLVGVYLAGPILNGIMLLVSHFFIVFINVFATFAHALRLHYVEFFGRFFIGGGTKFSPLTSERTYTTLSAPAKSAEEEEM